MKSCKYFVLAYLVLACSYAQGQIAFKEMDHEKIPVSYTGRVIDAYEFSDKEGRHLLLITKLRDSLTQKTAIFAKKYTQSDSAYRKQWALEDVADEIALHYPYTRVIDIDKDGVYETIFVYQLNPDYGEGSDWKVMLHFKNRKYALRAHVPELDHDRYTVSLDKAFEAAPAAMKNFVKAYWQKIVKEKGLKTK